MSSTQSITVLETLPDELLVMVLSYLHAVDRLRTFHNLNKRFDQCLAEIGVGIEDDLASNDLIVNKFATRIIYIRCFERNEELQLDQFPALRSLTLFDGVWSQICLIDPIVMPVITSINLKSNSIFNIEEVHTELLDEVFTNKYPELTAIHLTHGIFCSDADLFDTYIPLFGIRAATIGLCHASLFELLLGYLPNVIHLRVRVSEWHLANKRKNVKIMPDDWSHDGLYFLELEIDHAFKKLHFKWLKKRLPLLEHLDVDSRHDQKHSKRVWIYNKWLMQTFGEVVDTTDNNDK